MKNHNHDLIQQLSENADSIWRYEEYIKNAEGCQYCTGLWAKLKEMDMEAEKMLLEEIKRHVTENRFD
ncbi:MAG: hypothetical protein UV48_C0016G0010 [Candidatus Azambacteria bacterium GW2011_GWA2_42_9]|uniref:Uncharacterized protein n=3 Tax=Candidatus Azamiibacteriota TaxID=1752741 RepID=A0A0G0Z9R5_9BACT|nr:MAG: hypothetical protein UV07_C0024G0010 [Candidatus Azambacteria bacterium GW2011_GWB1_42_17]KKS45389.1 MAG: hypothetical protein UV10_C0026G0007 [Candidatus Azambacteria bacterium GW2011_GWA1_42_19]KKS75219.1 MAG: hypothetical protein UV48_C0016G0010 [Candidatus Azambacteria bacterium GW2011_GWA2_42_9]KKS87949.1 MAG: hypothetical protein UV62_C0020G0010 [Parcubacteria group bacterium GW2011_GWC1_43_11]